MIATLALAWLSLSFTLTLLWAIAGYRWNKAKASSAGVSYGASA